MGMLLEGFQFHPKVSVSEGEFVIRLSELGLIAGSAGYEAALDELIELTEQQAQDFLDRLDFYMQTDRQVRVAVGSIKRCALQRRVAPSNA
jgi:hypothetical protein